MNSSSKLTFSKLFLRNLLLNRAFTQYSVNGRHSCPCAALTRWWMWWFSNGQKTCLTGGVVNFSIQKLVILLNGYLTTFLCNQANRFPPPHFWTSEITNWMDDISCENYGFDQNSGQFPDSDRSVSFIFYFTMNFSDGFWFLSKMM